MRSASRTSTAFDSRASRVSRTAADLLSIGAPSSTTSANAPLRNSTSAHHAARAASRGRMIHTPSASPRCTQSRASSVRCASTYATQPWAATVDSTIARASVVFPLPAGPAISVSRPRGSPPPSSTASSAETPVGSAGVGGGGGGRSLTSSAIDRGMPEGEAGIGPIPKKYRSYGP